MTRSGRFNPVVWLGGMTLRLFAPATRAVFLFRAVRLAICSRDYGGRTTEISTASKAFKLFVPPGLYWGSHKIAAGIVASRVSQ